MYAFESNAREMAWRSFRFAGRLDDASDQLPVAGQPQTEVRNAHDIGNRQCGVPGRGCAVSPEANLDRKQNHLA